jgi:excinuclease ABC subunit A
MSQEFIHIKGARVHNLKSVEVFIPHGKMTVITGLSGSGKSSLAFDTLYAEGQRRYVESLSSYARQFLGKLDKPDVDFIKGISPAIAIEQKVISTNPRSTVGTTTEIYDYLKLLFARIGRTYSPLTGKEVKKHQVQDVVAKCASYSEGTRLFILSPFHTAKYGPQKQFQLFKDQGYARVYVDGETVDLDELLSAHRNDIQEGYLLIDRISVPQPEDEVGYSRIADSIQLAFAEGHGHAAIAEFESGIIHSFSTLFEEGGMEFTEPTEHFFTFNNPYGACPTCEGYGSIIGIDSNLVIPDKSLSVYQGAVLPWKGETMGEWLRQFIIGAAKCDFPIHKPIHDLTEEQLTALWKGNKVVHGIDAFFSYLENKSYKIQHRVLLSRYRGKTLCPDCRGTRLRKDTNNVLIGGKNISDLVLMPITELAKFFQQLDLSAFDKQVAKRLLPEIENRLRFLLDVGLGYLTLNRQANSLSGGESQRINLATSLGSSLVGSLYILDEPSIGLHPRDTEKLISVLKNLRELGNTVIIVEHEEDVMRAADEIIDMGPEAGINGGTIVFQGTHDQLIHAGLSLTADYLTGKKQIPLPTIRRKANRFITVEGARQNNLKNITVSIPLNSLVCISGVSGSGKSTLIKGILVPLLRKHMGIYGDRIGECKGLSGDLSAIDQVELIDQNPIGKSSRSNPVTYLKAFDEIRDLMSRQSVSKIRNYKPGFFSFNVPGGRCEQCEGEGTITVSMQFMADVHLECDACKGSRYKTETLDVTYKEKHIADILNMDVDEALAFFQQDDSKTAQKICEKLMPLQKVGLGYIKLGQPSSTLSGGEAQRIKLASFLVKGTGGVKTLFFFDEPTTGLHFHDISKLLIAFNELIALGHSIVVIEHNSEVLKCADHIIDLGPDGGEQGGHVLFEGTPEELIHCSESYTGKFLKEKITR